jgi:hypothetical protein
VSKLEQSMFEAFRPPPPSLPLFQRWKDPGYDDYRKDFNSILPLAAEACEVLRGQGLTPILFFHDPHKSIRKESENADLADLNNMFSKVMTTLSYHAVFLALASDSLFAERLKKFSHTRQRTKIHWLAHMERPDLLDVYSQFAVNTANNADLEELVDTVGGSLLLARKVRFSFHLFSVVVFSVFCFVQ